MVSEKGIICRREHDLLQNPRGLLLPASLFVPSTRHSPELLGHQAQGADQPAGRGNLLHRL